MQRRKLLGCAATSAAVTALGCGRAARDDAVPLWFSYGGNNRKVLLSMIERFHREQTAVRIAPVYQGDYFEGLIKLRTGLFVNSVPAISHVVGEVIPYLVAADALEPLHEVGEATLRDLSPQLAQHGTFAGGTDQPVVALPFNRSTPVAYCNKPLFDELGLAPPATWHDLRDVARRATRKQQGRTVRFGFECPVDWWFWIALTGQAGGQVIEPDGRVSLGGDAGVAALQLWQQMVHEDGAMKPPAGRDYNAWEATNSDFLAGRAAMIWTSTAFLRYLEQNASFEVLAAPLPQGVRHAVPTGGTFFVMPRGVPERYKPGAYAFLRWMMNPTQANEWATRTGYMPVSDTGRRQLSESGFYDKHPNFKVTLDQLAHALPWPWAPELFRVQREAVQPRLEKAVLERSDARVMLAEAVGSLAAP